MVLAKCPLEDIIAPSIKYITKIKNCFLQASDSSLFRVMDPFENLSSQKNSMQKQHFAYYRLDPPIHLFKKLL